MLIVNLLLSFLLTYVLVKIAPKIGLIDMPNNRSIHENATPRGAGIAIILATCIGLSSFYPSIIINYAHAFIGLLLVFLIGIFDDLNDTLPSAKIYVVLLAAMGLIFSGFLITNLGLIFGIELKIGLLAYPFTLFAILAFTNALNLIDGLDGLSGGISIAILLSLAFVGYINDDTFLTIVPLGFVFSLLGFLILNWHPAKIFMGDSGSLTLGFVISMLSIKAIVYIPPVSILLIAAIPIMDSIIVLVRRKLNGVSFAQADKTHIHHILLNFFKGDVKKTVTTLVLLQISYSLLGLTLTKNSNQLIIFILFVINLIIYYLLFTNMHKRQQKKLRKKLSKQ